MERSHTSQGSVDQGAKLRLLLGCLALLVFAPDLMANTASPLMFQRLRYLMWANVLIALVEAGVVCAVFKARPLTAIPLLIAANYASAWIGFVFYGSTNGVGVIYGFFDDPVLQMRQVFWLCFLLSLLASIAVEWPCFAVALPGGQRTWRRSLGAVLVGQFVSYTCCCMWMSGVTIPAPGLRADAALTFAPGDHSVWVYYVDHDSHDVHRVRLDGTGAELVLDANLLGDCPILGAYRAVEGTPWQLWGYGSGDREARLLVDDFGKHAGSPPTWRDSKMPSHWTLYFAPEILDLRGESEPKWTYRYDYYSGIRAARGEGGEWVEWLGFDTPFGSWQPHAMTVIPGDLVVFEMAGRVVLWDVEARRYGVMARGFAPVVGLDR